MTAAQADAALMGLARDVLADVTACQVILAKTEVKGYVRREHGKLEQVRPFERLEGEAAHEHVGVPGELPDDSLYELGDYKNQGYRSVNPYLRSGGYRDTPERRSGLRVLQKEVQNLDKAFELAVPTSQPVRVYRGANGFLPLRTPPGTILHDRAYMSTTTDKDTAAAFAAGGGANPKYAQIVRITVPAGESMISMEKMAEAGMLPGQSGDEEHEILLPRDRDMRVIGSHGRFLDVELLPAKAAGPAKPAAPARTPAQSALEKAMAYKKAQTVAASHTSPDRSDRFCWKPGDIQIIRPPSPIP